MKEDFLHYLWQHQYFDKAALQTQEGEAVQVLRVGMHNTDAGPDFLNAQVRVGEVTWVGSVEIHVRSSDWQRHQHQADPRYDQVVLHVVWEDDLPAHRIVGTRIPTVALRQRVSEIFVRGYDELVHSPSTIPCAPLLGQVPAITRQMKLDRTLMERLDQKAAGVMEIYARSNADWETTAYRVVLTAFGFKINQDACSRLSRALPLRVLKKHRSDLWRVEALLMGQAGLLGTDTPDAYLEQLRHEYAYLAHKYNLLPEALRQSDWNYLRLRPANFPAVRLAQFTAFFTSREHVFAELLEQESLVKLQTFFEVEPSDYWKTHYIPGQVTSRGSKGMGRSSIQTLMANTVVPLLVAYGRQTGNHALADRAIGFLEKLPAEQNRITRMYEALGMEHQAAADSQALLLLYHQYCGPRRCLHCAIGNHILKQHLAPRP